MTPLRGLSRGASRKFDFNVLENIRIACGVELLPQGIEPQEVPIRMLEGHDGEVVYEWNGLQVRAPTRPFAAGA